jgi:hypothetical protein
MIQENFGGGDSGEAFQKEWEQGCCIKENHWAGREAIGAVAGRNGSL